MEQGHSIRPESRPNPRRRVAIGVTTVAVLIFLGAHARLGGSIDALLAWPLAPFALALFALRRPNVNTARSVGISLVSGLAAVAYGDLVLARRTSTDVLNFIFVPLWHLLACGLVVGLTTSAVARLWSRLTRG
jgi:hypothetical protein